MIITRLRNRPYLETLRLQRATQGAMVERRRCGEPVGDEHLLLVEHQPVYTLGRHGKPSNMLHREFIEAMGAELVEVERGGDITFHGPGQLVAYPIIDLQRHGLGVKAYVDLLEESVIRTIAQWGIRGERVEGATGVWVGQNKICAIGVSCRRFITMHGLALNVNTDLSWFSHINPCGFTDRGVTSVERETGAKADFEAVSRAFADNFLALLN